LKNKVADFESKIAALKKEVDETRKSCQDEALKRVNCENQIATLTETLDFERKVSKERIEEFSSGPGESFNAKVEFAVSSRLAQALEDMRAEHEAELESTVNKLKYQYSSKIESADEKISSLQEKERELASSLKNSELTRYNLEKSNKSSIYSLKRQIEKFEENVENLKSDISCEKAEKDKVLVDLQSRKAVWEENETDYLSQIKVLQVKLDAKNLQEQQLRSELSKFGSLMNVAEERYNVSSPDREQMRSIRKAKRNARSKRLRDNSTNDSASDVSSMPPPNKKIAVEQPHLVMDENAKKPEENVDRKEAKDCVIM